MNDFKPARCYFFYVDVRPIFMSTCKLFMYVDMHLINKVHINIHMTHNLFNVDPQDIYGDMQFIK